jgi:hypothetical protein
MVVSRSAGRGTVDNFSVSVTSASQTPTANSFLTVEVLSRVTSGTPAAPTMSSTFTATWTQVVTFPFNGIGGANGLASEQLEASPLEPFIGSARFWVERTAGAPLSSWGTQTGSLPPAARRGIDRRGRRRGAAVYGTKVRSLPARSVGRKKKRRPVARAPILSRSAGPPAFASHQPSEGAE